MPADVNSAWGRVLADELARCGLRHAVIAPGSRSTPLVLALAAHPDVEDHSVIDERAAAFLALGIARAGGAPAAVVTTSGTASANLLPAVVEADRAGVPLLLLTADRPPELRDAGDSQAADQVKLFGERVRWFHAVGEPSLDDGRLAYLRSTACEAWARAAGVEGPPGPVHLDVPFRKPLAPMAGDDGDGGGDAPPGTGTAGRAGGAPWRRVTPARPAPDPAAVAELALALAGARRPLILAGALHPADVDPPALPGTGLRTALQRLLRVLPVPVWAEATSCLGGTGGRGPDRSHSRTAAGAAPAVEAMRAGLPEGSSPRPAAGSGAVLGSADLLLQGERFRRSLVDDGRPDLVLRLGEAPLPWSLRSFVAELAAAGVAQWAVDPWARRRDPEHAVSRAVAADAALLLQAVAEWLEQDRPPRLTEPGWLPRHGAADRAARETLVRSVHGIGELFDGGVVARLGALLPEDAALVVSSSMPLRELEAFLPGSGAAPPDVFANRGVNGIDGVTATATGVAMGRRAAGGSRTVLVTGDVAFAHDLSGAHAAGRLGSDLVTVLVDNGGGAIFDHLPGVGGDPAFERHFLTPPGLDVAAVAGGLGWRYAAPESWEAFEGDVGAALAERPRKGPLLIHVRTDRHRSRELRREVLEAVGRAVDEAVSAAGAPDAGASTSASVSRGSPSAPVPSEVATPGPGLPGAGATPVLLLHGFTGSGAGLAELAAPLAAAGLPVLAPDLPGHGQAPVPADGVTLETVVASALGILERRGVPRAHWVGYSMGGRVALAAALERPEAVASLALIGASPGIEDPEARAERRAADEELARRMEEEGLAAFVDSWMARPLFASQARLGHRRLRAARAERLAGSTGGYAAALRGLGQGVQPSLWERLPELTMPVLLVAGTEDAKYTELTRRMAERIPDARVALIPGAGHAAWLEAPERLTRLLDELWSGLTPPVDPAH